MRRSNRFILLCAVFLVLATPGLAHHSSAAFNTREEVTVRGTIVEYTFRNPHVYMTLEVEKDDGSRVEMEVEAGAPSVLNPLGFTRDSVRVGEIVTVAGNPANRNPDRLMLGKELFKADGSYLPLNIASRSIYEDTGQTATSIAGTWFSPRTSFFAFLGGAGRWSVTEAGRTAMANVDPLETPQKDCIPIAAPGLMFYPVADTIVIEDDRVVMTVDWMGAEREIWLDGRAHPPRSETFLHGHSVGHWEGDALVVDSTNYTAHPMGLSTSLPGSTEKHLVERFEVGDDGRSLVYSGTMEDPVYLTAPVEWSGTWEYRPTMSHSNSACDVETARKFLND